MNEIIITAAEGESRADKFISDNSDISRSYASKLIADGCVTVNGKSITKKTKICVGDEVVINLPEPEQIEAKPENIPLNIVYEDDSVIVVNKPRGLVVHPAPGNMTGTLVNGLLYHCSLSSINGAIRPGIVHRIDKDTSGLLIVAKTNAAHEALSLQLKEQKALRKYWCIVNGNIKEDSGTIDKPIGRHPVDRKRMAVVEGGRNAVTHFKVLERFGTHTLVECTLQTGRTHQIRVHMASIGHSIAGDPVYGIKKERDKAEGQLLHAKTIGFKHPETGEIMEFSSELPEYFTAALNKLRNDKERNFGN
ncbi:MAG: RluA family pseudouridine synthase [Clostridia bacterium]|jgi:23S rRNA pseudouridine1911/1915/1917 synthase|nr:RluA family pseudouridine synthase [Clostridia bacterium]